MTEGVDYDESTYSHVHDFGAARSYYNQNAGRSYSEAKSTGKTNADLLPRLIKTLRRALFALLGDVTGSMGDAPGIYFSKEIYLQHEIATEYLGEDTDMLFGAFGDGSPPSPDHYPLQFRHPFVATMDAAHAKAEILKLITTEGGGGGQRKENSELALLYLLHNVSAPNAEVKVCVIITDEAPYDYADKALAREIAFVDLKQHKPVEEIVAELKRDGWKIYCIQRPYSRNCDEKMDYETAQIHQKWVSLLGDDYVAYLPDIDRVVDVSFGILGDATDKYDYFMGEIRERQLKDKGGQAKIDAAFRALRKIHAKHTEKKEEQEQDPGASKLHAKLDGKPGKKLL